jgi:hypothetical protein
VLVEALLGVTLVAVATVVVATVTVTSAHALREARHGTAATQRGLARLERLRAGPRTDGVAVETTPTGTTVTVSWQVAAGRGRPDRLGVEAMWAGHAMALESHEAWP